MSAPRLCLYLCVAGMLGSVQHAWFRAFLDANAPAFISTSLITVLWVVVLLVMYCQDRKRQAVKP